MMEHLFFLHRQARELQMRQMVKEPHCGRLTREQTMAKYQMLTHQTVTKWVEGSSQKTE